MDTEPLHAPGEASGAPPWDAAESPTASAPAAPAGSPARSTPRRLLGELEALDQPLYDAISPTPTPTLDPLMRHLTTAANDSRLSIAGAAILAAVGGPRGRYTAVRALIAVAITRPSPTCW